MYSDAELELRDLFYRHCDKCAKKHGEWAIFRFSYEGTFLMMDTWNGALSYRVGSGEYDYWLGFSGKTVYYLGMSLDWRGRDPVQYSDNIYNHFINKIHRELDADDEN